MLSISVCNHQFQDVLRVSKKIYDRAWPGYANGAYSQTHVHLSCLRWFEIVFEIFFTRKQFTFIYIIITFMVAT